RLEERLRELSFCRQRLRHVQEKLDVQEEENAETDTSLSSSGMSSGMSPSPSPESFWESIRRSNTVGVVLPNGVTDLDRAASDFVATLQTGQRLQLDQSLQEQVLGPLGGLYTACSGSGDPLKHLALPLLDHAATFLDKHLPITDVAQVELDAVRTSGQEVAAQIHDY